MSQRKQNFSQRGPLWVPQVLCAAVFKGDTSVTSTKDNCKDWGSFAAKGHEVHFRVNCVPREVWGWGPRPCSQHWTLDACLGGHVPSSLNPFHRKSPHTRSVATAPTCSARNCHW